MLRRSALTLPFALAAPLAALPSPASPALPLAVPICRGGVRRVADAPGAEPASAREREAQYLEMLGLLEGHLLVGRRLLEAGEARLAVPHFGHPIRELYTWLEPRLAARGAQGFEAELAVMEAWAEGGNTGVAGRFDQAWQALQPRLRAAQAAVAPALRGNARFMLEHLAMIVFDVAADYGESVERGRIVNVVEYHDSMGYLAYAAALAGRERARGQAVPAWTEAAAVLEALREKVYPDLLPPARPPLSISGVRAHHERLRVLAAQVPA